MKTLKPIEPRQVSAAERLTKVRWLGPDGGWRLGVVITRTMNCAMVWDQHRSECVELHPGQMEYDNPKDDAGNPK